MNLWAKRIGQLMMAAALFFSSCEEPNLGYKARSRFTVSYIEIPVPTSTIFVDSIVTSNSPLETFHRFLIGTYDDDKLGTVTASTFTQFASSGFVPIKDSLNSGTYDSVYIKLKFDIAYTYGSDAVTPQEIEVYELDDTLTTVLSFPTYYNKSTIPYNPTPLGSTTFTIDPDDFDTYLNDTNKQDTTITISFALDPAFGSRIYESAKVFRNPTNADDSVSWGYVNFHKVFKGLAIKPVSGDKILSFDPQSTSSKITVYFHNNAKDSIVLTFSRLTSFNQILSDRAGSDISAVIDPYTPYDTPERYVQNGVGILTKLDLSRFFADFVDTIPTSERILINSAELLIDGVPAQSDFMPPPPGFSIRGLTPDNRFKILENEEDTVGLTQYSGALNSLFVVRNDTRQSDLILVYSSDNNSYNGFLTLFAQELFNNRNETRYTDFCLYPVSSGGRSNPTIGKSVNRISFDKNNIKLRINYTRPTLEVAN